MAHNKERVEGLRQIMHLCGDYLPGLLPLIHKELEAETKKLMSEALHERNEHILAVRFAPPKAEPTTTKGKIDAKLEHIQQPLRIRALETPLVELDLQQKRQNELLKEFSKKIQSLEDDLEGVKIKHAKLKGSTDAVLSSHDKKFAEIKKINETFIELFRGIDENVRTIFFQTKKD